MTSWYNASISRTWKKSMRRLEGDSGPGERSRSTESGVPRNCDERCRCLSWPRLLSRTMIQCAICTSLSGVGSYLSDLSSWSGGRAPLGITDRYMVFDLITVSISTCQSTMATINNAIGRFNDSIQWQLITSTIS